MTVCPVTAVDGVVIAELPAYGRGHTLTTDAEMDQAVGLNRALELPDALLEQAYTPDRPKQVKSSVLI
jgi:hypothetical protein